jgi:maltooligosyltrehalose trehalohydrolase
MLQFAAQDTLEMKINLANPEDLETFRQSQLDPDEQKRYPEVVRLHTDLLDLRHTDPVLNHQIGSLLDGAVLGESCFVIRYLTSDQDDRLLVINFGPGLDLPHLPEPLIAPPFGCDWQVRWSSELPKYGGSGSYAPGRFGAWHITGECAQLLTVRKADVPFHHEPPKSGSHA